MWRRRNKQPDAGSESEAGEETPLSIGALIRQLISDVDLLIRSEFRTLQTEFGVSLRSALPPLVLILAGAVLVIGGIFTLLGAFVAWLTLLVGAGFAALIVGLGAGIAGWVLILRGRDQISRMKLLPARVARMMDENRDPAEGQDI